MSKKGKKKDSKTTGLFREQLASAVSRATVGASVGLVINHPSTPYYWVGSGILFIGILMVYLICKDKKWLKKL